MGRAPRVVLYMQRLVIAAPTGVQRYASEIVPELVRAAPDLDIELCSGWVWRGPRPDLGVRLSHPFAPRRTLHLAWTLTGRPRIERVLGRFDLLHPLAPIYPVPSAAPQVITINDLLPLQHPDWYPGLTGHAARRSIVHHARVAREVIVPSAATADDVERTLGVPRERITVIFDGVSGAFSADPDDSAGAAVRARFGLHDRPYVAVVGAVSARKNLEVLFAALDVLRRRGAEVPLLVAVGGDGEGADRIRAEATRLAVEDCVVFTGWVPDEELRLLLAGADALVHPSLFEGFGLTPLEAMAAGIPVVSSTGGSLPEVVGDAGLLLDPHDPTAWAEAIERVVSDGELRDTLVAAGRERAARFTWADTARRTIDVYRRVLG